MIPYICHFEAGVEVNYLNGSPESIFAHARKTGFANDPDDKGGYTMVGVILDTYKSYCRKKGYPVPTPQRLHDIPFNQWKEIFKGMFWDKMQADRIVSQGIANMCVDWLWISGTGRVKNIQRILGVKQDGIVGDKTIAAINSANPVTLFANLYTARVKYYKGCSGWWKYNKGWMRRLDAINADGSFTIYGKRI